MPVLLRPAVEADQSVIRTIVRTAGVNPFGIDWRRFLLAEVDGQIVGIGQIKPHHDGSRELASIAVIPAYQHRGIAHQVIEGLLTGETGTLYLICPGRLQTFYGHFGFKTISFHEAPSALRRIKRIEGMTAGVLARLWRTIPRLEIMRRP